MTEQTDAAEVETLGSYLLASHDDYMVNEDGWTVCICGHVAEGDDEARGAERALRVVRLVEADMAEVALKAWRSADARRGLSDHDELLVFAGAMTRWSERFRMAFDGEDYRTDRAAQVAPSRVTPSSECRCTEDQRDGRSDFTCPLHPSRVGGDS